MPAETMQQEAPPDGMTASIRAAADGSPYRTRRNRPHVFAREPFPLSEGGFMRNFYERGIRDRVAPFRGIRANEPARDDLFPLRATGHPLTHVVEAAKALVATMSIEQRGSCMFGLESELWYSWSNFNSNIFRHGLCFEDMDANQRELAFSLMRHCLSAQGFETARNIMKLNHSLGELCAAPLDYGEFFYWLSFMGNPSATEPWGWQIDGHHLAINCVVIGDQMVLSPVFFGSEPNSADWGKYAGLRVLKEEEELGYRLMEVLSPEQRAVATLGLRLPFDVFATSFRDNMDLDYEGIVARELTDAQKDKLSEIIRHFLMRERPGHAELHLAEALACLEETRFAWIGPFDPVSPFYYRVHSPVLLIEFGHQPGVAFANEDFTRWHTHTLLRIPNGNDYGKALLRQYYDRIGRAPRAAAHAASSVEIIGRQPERTFR